MKQIPENGSIPPPTVIDSVQSNGQIHVGFHLRELRERANLSVRELAALSGVGKSRISQMELNPVPNPSLSVLLALQQALQLDTIEALLGDLPSRGLDSLYQRLSNAAG